MKKKKEKIKFSPSTSDNVSFNALKCHHGE